MDNKTVLDSCNKLNDTLTKLDGKERDDYTEDYQILSKEQLEVCIEKINKVLNKLDNDKDIIEKIDKVLNKLDNDKDISKSFILSNN